MHCSLKSPLLYDNGLFSSTWYGTVIYLHVSLKCVLEKFCLYSIRKIKEVAAYVNMLYFKLDLSVNNITFHEVVRLSI